MSRKRLLKTLELTEMFEIYNYWYSGFYYLTEIQEKFNISRHTLEKVVLAVKMVKKNELKTENM